MKKFLLLTLVALTLSSMLVAQTRGRNADATKTADASSTCVYNFSSSSGFTNTTFCVTANGNITEFSNDGFEHIQVGSFNEGYGFCDLNSGIGYYDYAYGDSGNWNAPTVVSSSASSVKLARITSDGIWQITQTITKVPATGKGFGAATIKMDLKNLTGVSRSAYLLRFVDIDAAGDVSNNDWISTYTSVQASRPFFFGLGVTANTFSTLLGSFIEATGGPGPAPCSPTASVVSSGAYHGDAVAVQIHTMSIAKNSTKSVTMTYKPF